MDEIEYAKRQYFYNLGMLATSEHPIYLERCVRWFQYASKLNIKLDE